MTLDIGRLAKSRVLTGASNGHVLFTRLVQSCLSEPAKPEPLLLDFANVDVATASFLRESILAFRNHVRARRSMFYPVIANAKNSIREELLELCRTGGALMSCDLNKKGEVIRASLIGQLDLKQKTAFDLVSKLRETDATRLKAYHPEDGVKHATAWNNRLTSLVAMGLVIEVTEGRTKKYKPLFEGI